MTRFTRRYAKLSRRLSHLELVKRDATEDLDDGSLLGGLDPRALIGGDEARLFLDFYGEAGLLHAMEHYGILGTLRRKGLDDFAASFALHDDQHALRLTARCRAEPEREAALIAELIVRRERMVPDPPAGMPALNAGYDVLAVDWVSLQNPFDQFTEVRRRLPGQVEPGLGVGEEVMELLSRIAERLRLEAVVVAPGYFHNAVLYAPEMPFFDPLYMAQLQALERDLLVDARLSLVQATWAVAWGCVLDALAQPLVWRGEAQIKPHHETLRRYFKSRVYTERVLRLEKRFAFTLDRARFEARWGEASEALLARPDALASEDEG